MTQLFLDSKAMALVLDEKVASPCKLLCVMFSLLLQHRLPQRIFELAVERGVGLTAPGCSQQQSLTLGSSHKHNLRRASIKSHLNGNGSHFQDRLFRVAINLWLISFGVKLSLGGDA